MSKSCGHDRTTFFFLSSCFSVRLSYSSSSDDCLSSAGVFDAKLTVRTCKYKYCLTSSKRGLSEADFEARLYLYSPLQDSSHILASELFHMSRRD